MKITAKQLAVIKSILRAHIYPVRVQVYLFGSRLDGSAKRYSDLDLLLVGKKAIPLTTLGNLREAFEESALPFTVDLVDDARITPKFRRTIKAKKKRLFYSGKS